MGLNLDWNTISPDEPFHGFPQFLPAHFGQYIKFVSQLPHVLRRGPDVHRFVGLRVRIPPGSWLSVCCERCVLSGKGLCDGLITRPEESYRLQCV